ADRGERRVAAEPRPQPQGAGLRPPHRAVRAAVQQARPPHRAADGRDVPAAQLQGRADVRGGGDERHRGLRHAEGGGEARPDRAEKEVIGIRRATDDDRVAIARLHEAAIRALGSACYTAEEVDSWDAGVAPERYFIEQAMYVATIDDEVVAFGHY